jgi:hypothetical protein
MNQPIDKSQENIELATSPLRPEQELDAETAALRETWLAWGQLLEACDAGEEPAIAWRTPPAPARRRSWLPLAASVLAASLVVAAALSWTGRPTNRQPAVAALPQPAVATPGKGSPAAANQVASAVPKATPIPKSVVNNAVVDKKTVAAAAATQQPQSEEAIDQQIAEVGQQFVAVRQEWSSAPDPFLAAHYTAQAVQHDVDTGGL